MTSPVDHAAPAWRRPRTPLPHPHGRLLIVTLLSVVIADQLSKACVRLWITPGEVVALLGPVLSLTNATNRGIAWGMLSGSELRLPFMTAVSLLMFVVLSAWYRRLQPDERPLAITLALLLAGGTGNFIDRLLYREVTDFIALHLVVPWPVFNLADVAITVGIALFATELVRRPPVPEPS